jgi:hypothetical protein
MEESVQLGVGYRRLAPQEPQECARINKEGSCYQEQLAERAIQPARDVTAQYNADVLN